MGDRAKELGLRDEPDVAKARAAAMSRRPTNAEARLSGLVEGWGHQVKTQEVFTFDDTYYIADIYLPKCRTVLELDGKHHWRGKQADYDLDRDLKLENHGWGNIAVLRIPNASAWDQVFLDQLREFLETRKAEVATWARQFFEARRREKQGSRPVAAGPLVCTCVCGHQHTPVDPRKDVDLRGAGA